MTAEDSRSLRSGAVLSDRKLEALHQFVQRVVRERGKVSEAVLGEFLAAGWTSQQVLEVVLAVAIKAMSNYTNAIVGVPLDKVVESEVTD